MSALQPRRLGSHVPLSTEAALRSISKLARMLGVVGGWYLEVPGVKPERRRDTRGPAVEDIRRMLAATASSSETETRDHVSVEMPCCVGLNREDSRGAESAAGTD